MIVKNTASQKWKVFAFNRTTGAPVTGDAANITAKIDKDHAGVASITDTNPTEVEDGYYLFDLTQAETNANILDIYPESSTSAVVVIGSPATIHTRLEGAGGRLAVDAEAISGSTTAADNTEANIGNLDDAITDVMNRLGAPVGASISADIATVDANVDAILVDTSTTLDAKLDTIDGVVDAILVDTAEIGAAGAGLTAVPWNANWDAEVESEVNDALVAIHLDHLLAVDYDPAAKPGTATALFNELVESDAGVSRFTANALENAPDTDYAGDGSGFTAIPWNSAWDTDNQNNVTSALTAWNVVATTDLPSNFSDLAITVTTGKVTVGTNDDKTGYSLASDQSSVTIGTTTAVSNGVTLATSEDVYHADIQFIDDDASSQDEYTVTWFKNGIRQSSGITSPTIQVIKRSDGTDLVSSTAMTEVGSTGTYKYDETVNRIADGVSYVVVVAATIDSGSRSFSKLVGRDTSE